MRYWIQDEDATPQGFPLAKLIRIIIQQLGNIGYELWIRRSQGYGLAINEWDGRLDHEDKLLISPKALQDVSEGVEEWFYDLDAEIITNNMRVRFGLHDSTAMYIEAPEEFAEDIIRLFSSVKAEIEE